MQGWNTKWFYLTILSIIWGTSYILIKKGLEGFNPIQLGSVRIILTTVFLYIIGYKSLRTISREVWKWIIISGLVGSFFPVFLFAFAQTQIDSGIAAILNSLVPLFTIFIGLFFFKIAFNKNQLIGVLVGFLGAATLIYFGARVNASQNYWYAGLIMIASFGYAINVNIIKSKLQDVSPMGIAVGNFTAIVIPAIGILIFSGALRTEVIQGPKFASSLLYLAVLGFFSTCIAKVLFNKLVKIASPVFSVSVTYLIPIVGVFWGILDGEQFTLQQFLATLLIILGVYLVNLTPSEKRGKPKTSHV